MLLERPNSKRCAIEVECYAAPKIGKGYGKSLGYTIALDRGFVIAPGGQLGCVSAIWQALNLTDII